MDATKYQRWYDAIIDRAKGRSLAIYKESHHILPRSLGGGDYPENLVDLTYREHFLVHWLLIKIYDGEARRPMVYALHCMTFTLAGRIISGWQFETAKRAVKIEVRKRALVRRAEWEGNRKAKVQQIREAAKAAVETAPTLDPRRSLHRYRLSQMTSDWLNADVSRLRRGRRPWRGPRKRPQQPKTINAKA